jgi:hypothetical protein
MSVKSVFTQINDMRFDLNKMETRGTIDRSFVTKINALDLELARLKKYWADQKIVSVGSAFIFYSAMHNTELVLSKMRDRFNAANRSRDNPGIACDSLLVMPIISEVFQKTVRAAEEKEKLSPFLPTEMLRLVTTLRTTAKQVNLLPTIDEEIRRIDKNLLKQTAMELDKKFVASNLVGDV